MELQEGRSKSCRQKNLSDRGLGDLFASVKEIRVVSIDLSFETQDKRKP